MVKNLQEQEGPLSLLNKQSKLLMETLSPENAEKCQKDVSELERQRADCKKITEARLKRVNEAILQTEELETAMKETVHWMDDVDRFLEEITGTISEGDAETIESQVQEVEVWFHFFEVQLQHSVVDLYSISFFFHICSVYW